MRTLQLILLMTVLVPSVSFAAFDSGSNGSDGALTFAADAGVIDFDPAALNIDLDGDNVFHFTTITIPTGTTVRLRASILGEGKPVVWLASGAVSIVGDVDLDGAAGHADNATVRVPAEAGAGGFAGGAGANGIQTFPQAGNGPGGGGVANATDGDGGGYLTAGAGAQPGASYGNIFLLPLLGGSGGSGAGRGGTSPFVGAGGGAGGGAIVIASSVSIVVEGTISARGGSGGTATNTTGRRAGGGSGGAIRLIADSITGTGSVNVNRGLGSANLAAFQGSLGRVRVEALTPEFLNTASSITSGTSSYGSPGNVFPPANAPSVRVASIDSVNAPTTATGSFENPDVTINANGDVTISLEASNVPLGTVVSLTLRSEEGTTLQVDSTPLAGTLAASTATAGPVTIPNGFTRITVLASF